MKLFQNQLSFVIENILRPCILFKGVTCVYTKAKEISYIRPCVINKGANFSAESTVHKYYVRLALLNLRNCYLSPIVFITPRFKFSLQVFYMVNLLRRFYNISAIHVHCILTVSLVGIGKLRIVYNLNNIYLENNQNIQYIKHSKYRQDSETSNYR